MEIRELLSEYEFDGDNTPVIRGSALKALEGDATWSAKIDELMNAVDTWIPTPERDNEKPFLMSIEDGSQLLVVEQLLLAVLKEDN